ncbi:DUF2357 domain-containing protein [Bacillus toyonensis]|uniref:DUF2357 domain-containing protein n=3 Tax=Bacteria TaxID=2 RepID=UPI000BF178F4|nr:DUF2357 domain-containing protein [Bacillus toyonensis]PEK51072.1 hypothetical protein CN592_11750 [Bacillus toyonensis]
MANNESLLEISTDLFDISFFGSQPTSYNLLNLKEAYDYKKNEVSFQIMFDSNSPIIKITNKSALNLNRVNVYKSENDGYLPLFYENLNYKFILKSKDNNKYRIRFDGSGAHNSNNDVMVDNIVTGAFNFKGNVGVATLSILRNDSVLSTIEFSVFSLKLNFLEDRLIMLKELQEINTSIVLNIFKPTSSRYNYSTEVKNTKIEWLHNYIEMVDTLLNNLKRIEKRESNHIARELITSQTNKIRNIDSMVNGFLTKFGKKKLKNRKYLKMWGNISTNKTTELGYIKFLTENLLRRLNSLYKQIENEKSDYYKRIKEEEKFKILKKKTSNYRNRLKNSFWYAVNPISNLKNRTKFNFQQDYLTYEKNIKLLNRVLDIEYNGNNAISVMSMDKLYESWLYIKIIDIIAHIKEVQNDVKIKYYEDFFKHYLALGMNYPIKIGELLIFGNKEYGKNTLNFYSPIVPQRPDFSIELLEDKQLVIFDSKYKLQLKAKIDNRWKVLSNVDLVRLDRRLIEELKVERKEEDINTMHRYRDAIRNKNLSVGERAIKYAIILYPYSPEKSKEDIFKEEFKSIDCNGVGAIPVAPGIKDDKWMKEIEDNNLIPIQEGTEQIRILAKLIKDSINKN